MHLPSTLTPLKKKKEKKNEHVIMWNSITCIWKWHWQCTIIIQGEIIIDYIFNTRVYDLRYMGHFIMDRRYGNNYCKIIDVLTTSCVFSEIVSYCCFIQQFFNYVRAMRRWLDPFCTRATFLVGFNQSVFVLFT